MSIHTTLNSFRFFQRSLFKSMVSLICFVLVALLFFQEPALASEKSMNQDADTIVNKFYNGVSNACLVGASVSGTVGGVIGATGSLALISAAGVTGTSAAGLTSGLAALGSIVGGGMAAGVVTSAALPVITAVALGTVGCVTVDFVSNKFTEDSMGETESHNRAQRDEPTGKGSPVIIYSDRKGE